jgi:hypothetical protein
MTSGDQTMTSNKLIVALALLLSATSATLAQGNRNHRAYYDYSPGSAQSGAGNGYASGQPGPDSGAESQR